MSLDIDKWVDSEYLTKNIWHAERHAQKVEKACREQLDRAKIPYLASSRLKSGDSLKVKLKNMQQADPKLILTDAKIMADVFDIAGVRIAVYLPRHLQKVQDIIKSGCGFLSAKRDIREYGKHESNKPKYKAIHWIVKLNPQKHRDLEWPVEIQVTLVLDIAFGHVEHDYQYKKVHPDISPAELETLTAFGEAVDLSKRLLDQLSGLRQNRLDEKVESIYDLGRILSTWWHEHLSVKIQTIGPLEALWKLLQMKADSLTTRGNLWTFLTEHITPATIQETKAESAPNMELRPTVIVIHQVVAQYRGRLQPDPEEVRNEERYGRRLEVIMSTVLWLSDFFRPTDWEHALLEGLKDTQIKQLLWLTWPAPLRLIKDPSTFTDSTDDRARVDAVWNFFGNHSHPAVKLAWEISNSGVLRSVAKETDLFNRVFMGCGRRLQDLVPQESVPSLP